jgi:phage-related protein
MAAVRKPLIWLSGEIKTPPFSKAARVEAGTLLRRLQFGDKLGMPHARAMASIGKRCFELRVSDAGNNWRIFYRLEPDCILILGVYPKATQKTPPRWIDVCRRRLVNYLASTRDSK